MCQILSSLLHFIELGYTGLFLSAFLAATLLPISSEVVLSALLLNNFSPYMLVVIATVGNVLGSFVNYAVGYWLSKGITTRWIKVSETTFAKAKQRFETFGMILLFFAWVPLVGDPLTVVAGALRIKLLWFFLLVGSGKLIRYIVVSYITLQVQ